jgi:replicative DNA helicase
MSRDITGTQEVGYEAFMEAVREMRAEGEELKPRKATKAPSRDLKAARAVDLDAQLDRIVLGAIMVNGFAPLDEAGVELAYHDFIAPQHGAVMLWLRDHADQWTPRATNFPDIQRQLEVAGLADKIGQGSAAVLELMTLAEGIGPKVMVQRARELVAASIDRKKRALAADYAERRIVDEDYNEARAELAKRENEVCNGALEPPRFADFAALIAEGFTREMPTLCQYDEGRFLLYAGRINEIHGEPGVGKTNIALCICAEVMQDGLHVLYLDPEDNPRGIGSRFVALGGRAEDLAERFHYVQNPEPSEYAALHAWAREHKPALVMLDGLAEGLAAEGFSEDKPAEVLQYFRERVRPFTDAGCAVLISDHVAKDKDTRGRWPRGSGAKMGRYDGVIYEAQLKKPYSPDIDGFVRLVVAKDRNGGVGPVGQIVTDLHFGHDDEGRPDIRFEAPQDEVKGQWQPTALMEKISRFIEDNGPQTKSTLRGLGKHSYVDQAVTQLIGEGHVAVEQKGAARLHNISKPYREINGGRAAA